MKQTGRYDPSQVYDLDAEIRSACQEIKSTTENFLSAIPREDRNKVIRAMISELADHIE